MKSPDIDISGIGTVVQKRIKVQDENESHRELYTQHRVEWKSVTSPTYQASYQTTTQLNMHSLKRKLQTKQSKKSPVKAWINHFKRTQEPTVGSRDVSESSTAK